MILLGGCIVLFIVSVLQERGIKIKRKFQKEVLRFNLFFMQDYCFQLDFGSTAAVRGFYICTSPKRIRRMI